MQGLGESILQVLDPPLELLLKYFVLDVEAPQDEVSIVKQVSVRSWAHHVEGSVEVWIIPVLNSSKNGVEPSMNFEVFGGTHAEHSIKDIVIVYALVQACVVIELEIELSAV